MFKKLRNSHNRDISNRMIAQNGHESVGVGALSFTGGQRSQVDAMCRGCVGERLMHLLRAATFCARIRVVLVVKLIHTLVYLALNSNLFYWYIENYDGDQNNIKKNIICELNWKNNKLIFCRVVTWVLISYVTPNRVMMHAVIVNDIIIIYWKIG